MMPWETPPAAERRGRLEPGQGEAQDPGDAMLAAGVCAALCHSDWGVEDV